MRSSTDFTTRCEKCLVRREFCFCALVPTVRTRTRIVVVRHSLEGKRSTNTARIAMLALPEAKLLTYGAPERPFNFGDVGDDAAWMLFPDGASTPAAPPRTIVIIDGTWSQARRMVQRVPEFRAMPRMAISEEGPEIPRLRVAPRSDGMSTIEAMARAIAQIEGAEVARPLVELARLHVERSLLAKGVRGWSG